MKFLFLTILIFSSFSGFSQNSDTTIIYDKIHPNSSYDYKKGNSNWLPIFLNEAMKKSTIVVLNGKILPTDDPEFRTVLKKESYVDLQIIADEKSKTNIKRILLIKTKE